MAYRKRFRRRGSRRTKRSWGGTPSPARLAKEFAKLPCSSVKKDLGFTFVFIAVKLQKSDSRSLRPPVLSEAPLFYADVRVALQSGRTYPTLGHVPLTPRTVVLRLDTRANGTKRPPFISVYSTASGWKRPH